MFRCCLLMIVRDESNVICRALDSAKNLFDYYIICDTGSVDDTQDKIAAWAEENQRCGQVITREWKNFGETKSELWAYAYTELKHLAKYFIWCDADEVFITNPDNPLAYPSKEDADKLFTFIHENNPYNVFFLTTAFGELRYVRWNICRNDQLYVWKQPVHEYFEGTRYTNTKTYDGLFVLARKEGNSSRNPDRYKTDVNMFLRFLETAPDEPRATFYLAQSYESCGDRDNALKYYYKRIYIESGFHQERYIACLRAGRLSSAYEDKIKYFLLGSTLVPHRLECIYEAMKVEYNLGQHQRAVSMGMLAPSVKPDEERTYNTNDLFVEYHIYNYTFDFEFAISCYYANEFQKGIDANYRAFSKAPEHIRQRIKLNLEFFPKRDTKASNSTKVQALQRSQQVNRNIQVMIIDNFFEDPDSIRSLALDQPFCVKGNYPGFRTDCMLHHKEFQDIKQVFENILGKTITYWPGGYNGSFQYATKDMTSWIHRDATEYSAIIYLTPNAPSNSGTLFYRHKLLNADTAANDKENSIMNHDTYNESQWDCVDRIGNQYNRCVIFRGKRSHISGPYFGNGIEDGRLFLMFFFDC